MVGPVTLRYDEARLVEQLSRLPPAKRTAFAAVCAERMLPIYWWFHARTGRGDPAALEDALSALWASLLGDDSTPLETHRNVAEELVPHEDDNWVDECAWAQHAAAAVAYAVRCRLTNDPQEAAWAARQVYEALDLWVTTRDDADMNATGGSAQIAADPLIQDELGRQERDIQALREAPHDKVATVASQMRRVARADGSTMFGTSM